MQKPIGRDRDLTILFVVIVLLLLLGVFLLAIHSPTTEHTQLSGNTPQAKENTTQPASNSYLEQACALYSYDLKLIKPTSPLPYKCLLNCPGVEEKGFCPEVYLIQVVGKELAGNAYNTDVQTSLHVIFERAKKYYDSMRRGSLNLKALQGVNVSTKYYSLDLYAFLDGMSRAKDINEMVGVVKNALRFIPSG